MKRKADARLLYFEGCPNAEQARRNLREALEQSGLEPTWEETEVTSTSCPEQWRGFPSPSVLVGGRDIVTGATEMPGGNACRSGEPPSVDMLREQLAGGSRSWWASLSSLPAAFLGLFPGVFCPACYPALAGLLSSIGLGAVANSMLLKPLTIVFLVLAILGLVFQARRSRNYVPLAVGLLGAVGVYLELNHFPSTILKVASIGSLVGASFWNFLLPGYGKAACAACETKNEGR